MRASVPAGLVEAWDHLGLPARVSVVLSWRGGARYEIGAYDSSRRAFRYTPRWLAPPTKPEANNEAKKPDDLTSGEERPSRLISKALTRAGWQRPRVDPRALAQLIELRQQHRRLELIFDTNALDEGVGHWLVDLFADRCDLVITAISLRELQDHNERSGFGKNLDMNMDKRTKCLGSRQLYLAGNRFRERPGYERVLWRELEVEDAALLLAAGERGGDKSSGADTLLLRAVRRSIQNRVNNLERLFVVGDTALARRATTELPPGSVVAAQVLDLQVDRVYVPCEWWPGGDMGARSVRHPARIVWELLAVADAVELVDGGRTWTFRAFDNPMWPSDYDDPWIDIEPPPPEPPVAAPAAVALEAVAAPAEAVAQPAATHAVAPALPQRPEEGDATAGSDGAVTEREAPVELPPPATSATPAVRERPSRDRPSRPREARRAVALEPEIEGGIWPPLQRISEPIPGNLRLRAPALLDVLAVVAAAEGNGDLEIPEGIRLDSEQRGHLRQLLGGLDIAEVDRGVTTAKLLPSAQRVQAAWRSNDLDALYDILRGWSALAEVAEGLKPSPARTEFGSQCARSVAAALGQGLVLDRHWLPGGRRPSTAELRAAVVGALPTERNLPKALSIESIVRDIFLRQLRVSPARVCRSWDAIRNAGVFEDFEFRLGGSPGAGLQQTVARLEPGGWRDEVVDLRCIGDYRDVVWRGADRD